MTLPVLTAERRAEVIRFNNRALSDAEAADHIRRRRNPSGPGLGDADGFEEVTAEGDTHSHGWDEGSPVTWCGRVPTGILPAPTGIWCPDCVGHYGSN